MAHIFDTTTRVHAGTAEDGTVHLWGHLSGGTYCGQQEPIVGPAEGEPDDWDMCETCRLEGEAMGVIREPIEESEPEEVADGDDSTTE